MSQDPILWASQNQSAPPPPVGWKKDAPSESAVPWVGQNEDRLILNVSDTKPKNDGCFWSCCFLIVDLFQTMINRSTHFINENNEHILTSWTRIISGMRHFLQAPPCSSRQLLATGHPVSGIQTLKCKDFKIYRTPSGNSEMCEKKVQNDMVGYPHSPQTSQAWDAPPTRSEIIF